MNTHITAERDDAPQLRELPPLTTADRLALAIGTRLILRTEQRRQNRAAQAERAEQAQAGRAAADADAHRTFEHRSWAGPTW